jgi:hypothetical protein
MPAVAGQFDRIPVRVVFSGVRSNATQLNKQPWRWEKQLDYYDFQMNKTPKSSYFETPSGVFCYNRKKTRLPPKYSDVIHYSQETVQGKDITYTKDLFYNGPYNLISYEQRSPLPVESFFYSTDPIKFIRDYNVGVQFAINQKKGNCYITTLSDKSFDADSALTDTILKANETFIVTLKAIESLLFLDAQSIYTKNTDINGMSSNIFIANKEINGILVEYAFTDVIK